jgi:hypothetical protein
MRVWAILMNVKTRFLLSVGLVAGAVWLGAPARAQDEEADPVQQAGENLGRTEADDETEPEDEGVELGRLGVIEIPFSVPQDCVATLAIYTTEGQLVRILGQALKLKRGSHIARWDGLDLFGNVVAAGASLEVKLIINNPIRAFYEFSVSAPKVAPWGGSFGEGVNRRVGGWLGDHSAPGAATAVGEKILLGCSVAEHGSNLIAVNPDGEKLWGAKVDGWSGVSQLTSDGTMAWALHRRRGRIYRVNPDPQPHRDGTRVMMEPVYSSGPDRVQTFAAHAGKLHIVRQNHEHDRSPFTVALANGQIDFVRSRPQILDDTAPTEFMIGARTAWGNVFTSAGNPQNGATMMIRNHEAFAIVVFNEPVGVGTVALGRVTGAKRAQVWLLKDGQTYDEEKSPLREVSELDAIGGFDLAGYEDHWELLGETDMSAAVSLLTANRDGIKTTAMFIRCVPANPAERNWRPRLGMARIMPERFERLALSAKITLPADVASNDKPGATGPEWSFRMAAPVSEIYPANIVLDFGSNQSFDGVMLLNCINPTVFLDAYSGSAGQDPAAAGEEAWTQIGRYRGAYNRRLGYLSASKSHNEQYVHFPARVTARALRLRVETGFRSGKWSGRPHDNYRVELDDVALVRVSGGREIAPSHIYEVFDAATGKAVQEFRGAHANIAAMAFAPDGALYTAVGGRLCRTTVSASGLTHQPLSDEPLPRALSLAASADRVAVGDGERHAVVVFDRAGRVQTVIGEKGPRQRGRWDPERVERPSGVAIGGDGSIWVAEELFAPKRVARYGADGRFIEEFLGPTMYGGGGWLDPNLKSFYYRSMEFELDWQAGTSRLKNLNDRLRSEETPVNYNNSFAYTGIGQPIYHRGRRYIVGENSISLLEDDTWRPCVVMGNADQSHFLLGKEVWKRHWARMDLRDKIFIWCDHNGDGRYQVEEVELVAKSDLPGDFRGMTVGPDLTLWSNSMRAVPSEWTAAGVPVFRARDFQPFDSSALAPHYARNYTLGGPRSAKPHYFGFKYITQSGALAQEAQPWLVLPPDAQGFGIKGGPVTTRPGDYLPPIDGVVLQQPWKFTGGAMTKSDIGEVAVANSNLGYWYVWAVDYGVVVGTFFTGEAGGWGWGLPPERGLEVTGRKQEWEGWGGHFIKAQDGNYYAAAGKGFHGISRIEGLDDFKVVTIPLPVSAEQHHASAQLRPILKGRYDATRFAGSKDGRKEITAATLAQRTTRFKLDGELEDWGPRARLHWLGEANQRLMFDVAHDENGLYIALSGENKLGGASLDWRHLFRAGFGFEFLYRTNPRSRARDIVAGDRRIVFGKHDGAWTAVLYEYALPEQHAEAGLVFPSRFTTTTISRVTRLSPDAFQIAVKQDTLGLDPVTLDAHADFGELPTLPGIKPSASKKTRPTGLRTWTAEVFLPWSTLGVDNTAPIRCDFGVLDAAPGAVQVESVTYWSNRYPGPLGDPAFEALPNPGAWGWLRFR